MAEWKKSNSSDSDDDSSSLEADAVPIPLPAPQQTVPRPDQKKEETPKAKKEKTRKKKPFDAFDNCIFKNGGFAGMFNGTNNISHKGQTYYAHIENANNVHIGPNITQVIGPAKKTPKQNQRTEWQLPKHYFASTRPVTVEILRDAVPFIGLRWRPLGRDLGFCDGELDTLDHDYGRAGLEEIVYHLFMKWQETNGKAATIGRLIEALWKIGCRDSQRKIDNWMKTAEVES